MSQEHYSPKTADTARAEDLAAEPLAELEAVPDEEPATEPPAETAVSPAPASVRIRTRLPILLRLTRRAVLFLSLETLALILYYVSGNQQHFLEVNITIILGAMTVSSIALALFCAAGVAESVYYTFSWKRPRFLFRLIPYGLLFVIAVLLAVFSRTVDLLSLGW